MTTEKSDSKAEYTCMEVTVKALEALSRHYCELNSSDSVARKQATNARIRILQWLCNFIENHPYL